MGMNHIILMKMRRNKTNLKGNEHKWKEDRTAMRQREQSNEPNQSTTIKAINHNETT
jgi:hypothetical protein